jgi:phosphate/sulfate permease
MGDGRYQARFSCLNDVSAFEPVMELEERAGLGTHRHSIIGGIIGVGIATIGSDGVSWSWRKKGVAQVVAAWFIAPAIAGAFASIIFLITEYGVLRRKNSLHAGLLMIPVYFGVTSGILTMLIVWKGGKRYSTSTSSILHVSSETG